MPSLYSDKGYLWVAANNLVAKGEETGYPNYETPRWLPKVQKLSLEGEILKEIDIIDLLLRNDLYGLLFLSSRGMKMRVGHLHLNDVDEFPLGMESKLFEPGDLMVSLRNINTILVFDPETLKIKFISSGRFLRKHDPDFLPGDRISVFDNRNLQPSPNPESLTSRIVEIDARDGSAKVVLQGEGDHRFFSSIMGVHQRLANGNILVNSSDEGRVIEFAPDGTIMWHFENRIPEKKNGRVYMATLLPEHMDSAFFAERYSACNH